MASKAKTLCKPAETAGFSFFRHISPLGRGLEQLDLPEILTMRDSLISGTMMVALGVFGAAGAANAQDGKSFSGIASYYAKNYSGKTASGERYDETKMTAAHKTLPFGTKVVVTDKKTNRSVTVRINDRGPFIKGRVIDLSYAAASEMKMHGRGLAQVTVAAQ